MDFEVMDDSVPSAPTGGPSLEDFAQMGPELSADLGQHLGLDRQQDDVRTADRFGVRDDRADAVQAAQLVASLGARMTGHDPFGRDELTA